MFSRRCGWKPSAGKLDALPLNVRDGTRLPIGTYQGLTFGVVLHERTPTDVYVEGKATRQTSLSREHHGPRAVLNAIERLVSGYGPEAQRIGEDLAIAVSQLRDYRECLGATFGHEGYIKQLTDMRNQLKAGLSGNLSASDRKSATVAEVAEHIKAIMASQNIDATPQRAGQRQVTAAEPITASIRRRAQAVGISDDQPMSIEPEMPPAKENGPRYEPLPQPTSHQQRIARRRKVGNANPSLT